MGRGISLERQLGRQVAEKGGLDILHIVVQECPRRKKVITLSFPKSEVKIFLVNPPVAVGCYLLLSGQFVWLKFF